MLLTDKAEILHAMMEELKKCPDEVLLWLAKTFNIEVEEKEEERIFDEDGYDQHGINKMGFDRMGRGEMERAVREANFMHRGLIS